MSLFDDAKNMALRLFALGRNANKEIEYEAFVEGVPTRDSWFRMSGSDGSIVGQTYVCRCATEYRLNLDFFTWGDQKRCGCGQAYCLREFLERKSKQARIRDAALKAGLSPNPTGPELEMARQLGKKITVKAGPVEDKELRDAYVGLPIRRATGVSESAQRFIDTWDEKHGASSGSFGYNGANPGPEDVSQMGFNDPFSVAARRR